MLCRLCLKEKCARYTEITKHGGDEQMHLAKLIKKYLNLQIMDNDVFSNCICRECEKNLLRTEEYITKISKIQSHLRKVIFNVFTKEPKSTHSQYIIQSSLDVLKKKEKVHKNLSNSKQCIKCTKCQKMRRLPEKGNKVKAHSHSDQPKRKDKTELKVEKLIEPYYLDTANSTSTKQTSVPSSRSNLLTLQAPENIELDSKPVSAPMNENALSSSNASETLNNYATAQEIGRKVRSSFNESDSYWNKFDLSGGMDSENREVIETIINCDTCWRSFKCSVASDEASAFDCPIHASTENKEKEELVNGIRNLARKILFSNIYRPSNGHLLIFLLPVLSYKVYLASILQIRINFRKGHRKEKPHKPLQLLQQQKQQQPQQLHKHNQCHPILKQQQQQQEHYQQQEKADNKFMSNCKLLIHKSFVKKSSGMASSVPNDVFKGTPDRFNGVTLDSAEEYKDCKDFPQKLKKSLAYWRQNKNRCIWFQVRKEHHTWIGDLIKEDFEIHNAKPGMVVLYKWLPTDEPDRVPSYAHTMIGAGGIVLNDKNEILVVSERYAVVPGSYKLPGGYVDPGENIVDGVIREIREETNVLCEFDSFVAMRHNHKANFNCSDMYFVIALKPCKEDIEIDCDEIIDAKWMPINEFLKHPKIHALNKSLVQAYLNLKKRKVRFIVSNELHPVLDKIIQLYHIEHTN